MNENNKVEKVNLIMGGYDPVPALSAISTCLQAQGALLNLTEVNCDKPLSEMTMREISHLASCGHKLNTATYSSLLKKVNKMPNAVVEYSIELELKALATGVSEHIALAEKAKNKAMTERGENYYVGSIDAYSNVLARVEAIISKLG